MCSSPPSSSSIRPPILWRQPLFRSVGILLDLSYVRTVKGTLYALTELMCFPQWNHDTYCSDPFATEEYMGFVPFSWY